jgi:hypothetical protein
MTARRILRELAWFIVPALLLSAVVAWDCARRQEFIGTFDTEQFFWQGLNMLAVVGTGSSNVTRSFLGIPTPYTYTPSMQELSLPLLGLSAVTNPYFAYNLLVFVVLIANGSSMYALLRAAGLRPLTASLGGVVYLLAPTTLGRSMAHIYLAQTFFLPALFYLAWRDVGEAEASGRDCFRGWHWALMGALAGVMTCGHEYLGLICLAQIGLFLVCRSRRLGVRRLLGAAAAAAVAFVLIAAPVVWMYPAQHAFDRDHGTWPQRPLEESIALSASPADFFMPSNDNGLYRHFSIFTRENRLTESLNYLGLLNMGALLVLGFWAVRRRERLHALLDESPLLRALRLELTVTAVGALVVSLGPRWKSHPSFMLPVQVVLWMHCAPFTLIRGWGRFGFILFFVLTMLTAHLVEFAMRRGLKPWAVLLLFGLAIVDQVPLARLPTFRVPVPSAVNTIRDEPGDFMVLHLPMDTQSGALHNSVGQFLQLYSHKRIVSGYSAVEPPLFTQAVAASPLQSLDWPTMRAAPPCDVDVLTWWLLDHDVRYIVYENFTQFYTSWFNEKDDCLLRARTMRILREMQGRGHVQVIEDDASFTVYRIMP